MKDLLTDANFPRTADLRVYHLGLRPGEVANRIITVGSPSRAHGIAKFLDENPAQFVLASERGFTTITGCYKGVPISIVSIGMGYPNMDFFIREVRECLSGDMVVVRLGSCGGLVDVPVGSVVIPKASVSVTRNYDFSFDSASHNEEIPYRISKPVEADPLLHAELHAVLEAFRPPKSTSQILSGTVNASADSFYASQGRQTSFPDYNANLISQLKESVQDLATLEMETFHLFHLAKAWNGRKQEGNKKAAVPPPLTTRPVEPMVIHEQSPILPKQTASVLNQVATPNSVIRAAAVHMVFAARLSQDFITPDEVKEVEKWTGQAVLEALVQFKIPDNQLHPKAGSVWIPSA